MNVDPQSGKGHVYKASFLRRDADAAWAAEVVTTGVAVCAAELGKMDSTKDVPESLRERRSGL